jgi:hypothetical protein
MCTITKLKAQSQETIVAEKLTCGSATTAIFTWLFCARVHGRIYDCKITMTSCKIVTFWLTKKFSLKREIWSLNNKGFMQNF